MTSRTYRIRRNTLLLTGLLMVGHLRGEIVWERALARAADYT